MRLLITTQALDEGDPALSFFVGWLGAFSKRFERIEVICLKEGAHPSLPNVRVHSLGKESGASRPQYIIRFWRYIVTLRKDYDAVLIHMNQEYAILGGLPWKFMGKKVYMWRNHYRGSWQTDTAAAFMQKVFCTSRYSYTAKYKKTVFMPVGVDTKTFKPLPGLTRKPNSILFLARFSPSKRPDLLVEALGILKKRGASFSASFYGEALPRDAAYQTKVQARAKELGLSNVAFSDGIPNSETPRVYSQHDLFVDLGASGMYNKTIFEAAACGALVIAISPDFTAEMGPRFGAPEGPEGLAERIEEMFALSPEERAKVLQRLRAYAERNSLESLAARLEAEVTA